ncbi:MAG: translesion DNA synthesis-associated protein ImuA [Betaproteobacteria bacterium]|nr:MAG: translesion DNA synthesis-associated protein ImuA [Betaproteobacteria bacterium]
MAGTPFPFAALLERPDIWRGDSLSRTGTPAVPSGFPELDAELPGGGWPAGALTEVLPAHEGIGELRLLGPALAALSNRGLRLAWISPPHLPYAPALAAAGIDIAMLVVVRTTSPIETLWAAEQALVSNACGAVLAWPQGAKYAELRRLQIAAEGGRAPAFLFRSPQIAGEPSPAALRIALGTAAAGGLAVHVLKRRGAPLARSLLLPAIPPAVRGKNHHVDRHPAAPAAARDFLAWLVHA